MIALMCNVQNRSIYRDQGQNCDCLGVMELARNGDQRDGNRLSFRGDKNILNLIVVMAAQLCEHLKTTELYILKGKVSGM